MPLVYCGPNRFSCPVVSACTSVPVNCCVVRVLQYKPLSQYIILAPLNPKKIPKIRVFPILYWFLEGVGRGRVEAILRAPVWFCACLICAFSPKCRKKTAVLYKPEICVCILDVRACVRYSCINTGTGGRIESAFFFIR